MSLTPKQLAEHPLFEWRDGMRNCHGARYHAPFHIGDPCGFLADDEGEGLFRVEPGTEGYIPDLNDPPTLRCILEIIREQPGWESSDVMWFKREAPHWVVSGSGGPCIGETEADALFAAMNAILEEQGGVG